jgi:urocanate hydratase
VTDQTSAHDIINGYLPSGWSAGAMEGRAKRTRRSMPRCAQAAR